MEIGNESNKPWMPIKVTPTATNYIQNNLLSANPPPGATEQYVGTKELVIIILQCQMIGIIEVLIMDPFILK